MKVIDSTTDTQELIVKYNIGLKTLLQLFMVINL